MAQDDQETSESDKQNNRDTWRFFFRGTERRGLGLWMYLLGPVVDLFRRDDDGTALGM